MIEFIEEKSFDEIKDSKEFTRLIDWSQIHKFADYLIRLFLGSSL